MGDDDRRDNDDRARGHYARFLAMIVTATLVMHALTYLNTWALAHVAFSQTRVWMSMLMGAAMAVVMLAFMLRMYKSAIANAAIVLASVAIFGASLALVRTQATVGDVAYMKAMIPHHSIAILTSERARISDPRVRELADGIIETQRREIDEMTRLIEDLETR